MLHLTACRYGNNTKTIGSFLLRSVESLKAVYSSTNMSLGLGCVHVLCELANAQALRSKRRRLVNEENRPTR
jgi:hypothetical protein